MTTTARRQQEDDANNNNNNCQRQPQQQGVRRTNERHRHGTFQAPSLETEQQSLM
jgi:hypothetical protein